ncbi:hypothetical protein DFH05DRAFT_1535278 [Lentinula detonsa]|uniref:Uncharacterized protein n=1 Tax=Lentinula detonsa TaxID=2804962 RepID=A0A9W8P1Q2_9AGAR|nr:hypothetical protein DFH05DRAFT_1535278 [Lentinula detonsa]
MLACTMVTIQYSLIATALNITYYSSKLPIAPLLLPRSHAQGDGSEIVDLFNNLGRSTVWKAVDKAPTGDRFVVSAGEYTEPTIPFNTTINGTDRSPGAGFAHSVVFSGNGTRLADAILTKQGAIEYHLGGLDYDGRYIWATIAQYRPNSTASLVRVDPNTLEPTPIFHYTDHLGGIVHDTSQSTLTTLNWGSRNSSTWSLAHLSPFTSELRKFLGRNPDQCSNQRPLMLCSGVATIGTGLNLGGIAIVDVESMIPLLEIPITMTSDAGTLVTQNPVDLNVSEDGQLRLYWLPDQHNSTLYVYEAQAQSPFEFGVGYSKKKLTRGL